MDSKTLAIFTLLVIYLFILISPPKTEQSSFHPAQVVDLSNAREIEISCAEAYITFSNENTSSISEDLSISSNENGKVFITGASGKITIGKDLSNRKIIVNSANVTLFGYLGDNLEISAYYVKISNLHIGTPITLRVHAMYASGEMRIDYTQKLPSEISIEARKGKVILYMRKELKDLVKAKGMVIKNF